MLKLLSAKNYKFADYDLLYTVLKLGFDSFNSVYPVRIAHGYGKRAVEDIERLLHFCDDKMLEIDLSNL